MLRLINRPLLARRRNRASSSASRISLVVFRSSPASRDASTSDICVEGTSRNTPFSRWTASTTRGVASYISWLLSQGRAPTHEQRTYQRLCSLVVSVGRFEGRCTHVGNVLKEIRCRACERAVGQIGRAHV